MLKQAGLSLIELMIASGLGLVVLTSLTLVYGNNLRSSSDNLKTASLNQELRAAMRVMLHDIRRAGYWAAEPGINTLADNPFWQADNALKTGQANGETRDSCIVYSYDLNMDKRVGVGKQGKNSSVTSTLNVEQFGFRLHKEAIETRTGSQPFACNAGQWQDLTSPVIKVTDLQFILNSTCLNATQPGQVCARGEASQDIQHVTIHIRAQLSHDSQVQLSLSDGVRVRNGYFVITTP